MIWGFEAASLETLLSPRERGQSPLLPGLISSGHAELFPQSCKVTEPKG